MPRILVIDDSELVSRLLRDGLSESGYEVTVAHDADAGYRAVVASDGTSTVDDEWQNAALSYAMQNVASVGTCEEIAAALGG